jgi:hypothetical protein
VRSALPPCEGRCAAQPRIEHIVDGGLLSRTAGGPMLMRHIPRTESREDTLSQVGGGRLQNTSSSIEWCFRACRVHQLRHRSPGPPSLWRTGQAWPLKTAGWSAGLNGEAAAGNLASTPRASPHHMRVNPCYRMVGARFSDRFPDHLSHSPACTPVSAQSQCGRVDDNSCHRRISSKTKLGVRESG